MTRADAALRLMTAVSAVMPLQLACVTPIGWINDYGVLHAITTLLGAARMLGLAAGIAMPVRRIEAWSNTAVITVTIERTLVLHGLWVTLVDTKLTSNFLEYHRFATAVARGDVLSHGQFFMECPFKVAYALILGGFLSITASLSTIAGAVNILASCGMVVMAYLVTSRSHDRSVAFASQLLAAIWPLHFAFANVAAQEHIFFL